MIRSKHLAWLVVVLLVAASPLVAAEPAMVCGTGLSKLDDAKAAGADAAKQAKAALGETDVKLVLVYDGDQAADKAAVLAGVASVFDQAVVFGCPGYSPLTEAGNVGSVGVLAVGGTLTVTSAVSDLEGGHQACGKRLGEQLAEAAKVDAPGKLLLLFGDCHVPADDELVKGARAALGDQFPIVGGASKGGNVYCRGEVLKSGNVGVLLTGDFRCGFALKKDNSPEGLITSAGDAFRQSIGDDGDRLALVFAFDCGGRRGMLGDRLPKEHEAMKAVAPGVALFGFYGSGEIGRADGQTPACGVGYSISACAIILP